LKAKQKLEKEQNEFESSLRGERITWQKQKNIIENAILFGINISHSFVSIYNIEDSMKQIVFFLNLTFSRDKVNL
jgi:hypothetical protein